MVNDNASRRHTALGGGHTTGNKWLEIDDCGGQCCPMECLSRDFDCGEEERGHPLELIYRAKRVCPRNNANTSYLNTKAQHRGMAKNKAKYASEHQEVIDVNPRCAGLW